jgi:hypothetical protein
MIAARPNAIDRARASALDGLDVAPLPPRQRKSGARVAGGHLAGAIGRAWETWLSAQHEAALREGIAFVRHVGPPHVRTGPGGHDIKIIGHGPADFQGAIRAADASAPWRPLALEAKSREGRLQRSDLDDHQHEDLARVASVRGVALVVIELHDERGYSQGSWALPWARLERLWVVRSRARAGKAGSERAEDRTTSHSVGPEELVGWEVASGGIYLERFVGAV